MRLKIFGAGSIGNHLAHAARTLDWEVVVCDVSRDALVRMKERIYPERYGEWDPTIELHTSDSCPQGGFDLICIGTPPEHHLLLALQALNEEPRSIQIEKPVCPPSLDQADVFWRSVEDLNIPVFVGYDHVVGKAARKACELVSNGAIGKVVSLDVDFREHWQGIFAAHPWLDGPEDSYLGYWEKGGGASGEHSHATNLWQFFSRQFGGGRVVEVGGMMDYVEDGSAKYDSTCHLQLLTENGLRGRVVQDVMTIPTRKQATILGTEGTIEWICGYDEAGDAVVTNVDGVEEIEHVPKTRPDDFIEELSHIRDCLEYGRDSEIKLERGLDTILLIAAAHRSEREARRMRLDYEVGYHLNAITSIDRKQG